MSAPLAAGADTNLAVLRVLRATAGVFALAVLAIPLLVLLGWAIDDPHLKSVAPGLVAMNPLTAVAFILGGSALWIELHGRSPRMRGFVVRLLGAGIATIALLKLAGLALNAPLNIDRILFSAKLDREAIPNRMAPNTAVGFLLIGVALLLAESPRGGPRLSQFVCLTCAWLALLALIGYAYRAATLYNVGAFIPMALHTAAAFFLLSLGLLFAHADRGLMAVITSADASGALARRLLPVALLVPALLGWIRLEGARRRWFTVDLGLTLIVVANTFIFTLLLWWQLALLRRSDALRRQAEIELQEKHRLLAQTAASERAAHEALKQTQAHLVQSEKLAGLGQMVAGVAHEINNPLSFVSNNVAVLQRDLRGICELLTLYSQLYSASPDTRSELLPQIRDLAERLDLAYVTSNLPDLLNRSREGLRRIQQIVKDLRDFARLDESTLQDADLNAGITSTINIIQGHAKKKRITIEPHLAALPAVRCQAVKINQVVMNLLSNAIDASPEGGTVKVITERNGDTIGISVSDEGCGIDPAVRDRIFDPFFTTKPLGQGTGLGLSISYGIVKDHAGEIQVQSEPGRGSCFTVRLPVSGRGG